MEHPTDPPSDPHPSDRGLSDRPSDAGPSDPGPYTPPPAAPARTGLEQNLAGALSYLLGALTGILFLIIDKGRPFVRFHALQSILLTVAAVALSIVLMVLSVALGTLPLVGWLISVLLYLVIWLGGFVLWLYLMFRAYKGDEWELPVIGPQARRLAGQL